MYRNFCFDNPIGVKVRLVANSFRGSSCYYINFWGFLYGIGFRNILIKY